MYTGEYVPNYGAMGTESLPAGNRGEVPYGVADPTSAASAMSTSSMQQSGTDSARVDIGYRPQAGRADRLSANIPFVSGSYYNGRGSNV